MIESGATYLPQDRRIALARGEQLPERVEGAALFADISGFTPLTEALTRVLGQRHGVEELTAQVNRVYDALIAEVEAYGGSVVGFAGDAITCWFGEAEQKPGAALRAVACAQALQRAMGAFAAVPLPHGGTVSLHLKVAVASGPARHITVGDPALQQIDALAGATVARTAAGEHLAQRGEVVVDGPTAAKLEGLLSIGEWREADGESFAVLNGLLAAVPPAPWPATPALDEARFRSWLLPAVYDRLLDGLGEFLTELRPAAALFLSFEGIDYDNDPEAGPKLDRLIRAAQAVFARYSGNLLQLTIGDKGSYCYAAFGAPVSYEDNAHRAIAAALELRGLQAELSFLGPLRIGVSEGIMRAGAYGASTRRTYGVLGDEVNLAARLMQLAGPGEILVSGRVRDQLSAAFAWEALPPVAVKGKTQPVPLARLVGVQVAPQTPDNERALVGREPELARLLALARPIFAGHFAGVVTVRGEPGTGKSRLAAELRRRLGSAPQGRHASGEVGWLSLPADSILRQSLNPFRAFLRAFFEQDPDASPEANAARCDAALDGLIEALAAVGGRRRAASTALAAELARSRPFLAALVDLHTPGSLYEQLEPKLRFENTLAALKALILAESLRRPLVVFLEDSQWLDADSLAALQLLTRNIADYPILILASSRYHDDGSPLSLPLDADVPQQTVDLEALGLDGVRGIAEGVLGGAVGDELAAFLAEKTGGNPFFVEQLALDLKERELIVERAAPDGASLLALRDSEAVEIPHTINAVLIARLDRLAARVKAVVQTAAVLGQEFEVRLLSGMLRDDPHLAEQVREAERETIWTALNELRYLFRHALLRDAAYAMQLRARLRELHRLAAEVIERIHAADLPASAADLAYHYRHAEDGPQERRYARLAGEHAAARYANADAAAFFSRALELTPTVDGVARYELLLARERIYDLQGNREAQRADLVTLERLAEQLDEPQRQVEVALRRARYADVTGDYPAMIAAASEAIGLAAAARIPAGEAAGHLHHARALWYQGRFGEAQQEAAQARTLAESAGLRQLIGDSLRTLGNIAIHEGRYADALAICEQALVIHRDDQDGKGESYTLNNLGTVYWYLSDFPAARAAYIRSLEILRAIGDRYGQSLALLNLGEVAGVQGDYPGAQGYYAEALRLKRETGDRYGESVALTSLADTLLALGDWEGARTNYEAALALTAALGHRQQEGWVQARIGLLLHQQGDNQAALERSERALALAREINDRNTQGYALTLRGHSLAALGQATEAAEAYRQSLELRRALQQPNLAAEALAGLASLALESGDLAQASMHTVAILNSMNGGALEGADEPFRIHLTCYRILRAEGDERAGALLDRARALLGERAARIEEPSARRAFLERVPSHRELLGEEGGF